MPDFSSRSSEPEWMDGEDVTQEDFAGCLADLDRVNTLTLTRRPTLAFVAEALSAAPEGTEPVIVDVGFGAGDMAVNVVISSMFLIIAYFYTDIFGLKPIHMGVLFLARSRHHLEGFEAGRCLAEVPADPVGKGSGLPHARCPEHRVAS